MKEGCVRKKVRVMSCQRQTNGIEKKPLAYSVNIISWLCDVQIFIAML